MKFNPPWCYVALDGYKRVWKIETVESYLEYETDSKVIIIFFIETSYIIDFSWNENTMFTYIREFL